VKVNKKMMIFLALSICSCCCPEFMILTANAFADEGRNCLILKVKKNNESKRKR
jgi:hypothetical protein